MEHLWKEPPVTVRGRAVALCKDIRMEGFAAFALCVCVCVINLTSEGIKVVTSIIKRNYKEMRIMTCGSVMDK